MTDPKTAQDGEPSAADESAADANPENPEAEGGEASEAETPTDGAGGEENTVDDATRIADLERKVADREDALLRLKAESDNARKRAQRDVESAHKFALERFVNELLPVRDSMLLGIAACESEGASLDSVKEGIELTDKSLVSALERFGVAVIDPEGEAFNPELHQAVSMQPAEGVGSGQVVMVIQKGYTLNERLVRPAMVIVSQ